VIDRRRSLEVSEESPPQPDAAALRVHPHAFDLGRVLIEPEECAAPDDLVVELCDDEPPRGLVEGRVGFVERLPPVEARREPLLQFAHVPLERHAGLARAGVDHGEGGAR
jgi:hypothetical protein